MNTLKKFALLLVVFLTGAAILIVEIVAVRVLSPYFGNTIFTVSSVISVILAALSLGYFYGGRLADRHPSLGWFFGIILIGGISVLIIQLFNVLILPALGYVLPITTGPLFSSVLLFFVPGFLLGMLSPYVIKLQKLRCPDQGLGSVAGEVFFWSTLGSILGSLAAGFILIPLFGISEILIGVGVFLVLLGLVPLLFGVAINDKIARRGSVAAVLLTLFATLISFNTTASNVVFFDDGVYERLVILDLERDQRTVRYFLQDRSESGAIYVDTGDFAHDYLKFHRIYKLFHNQLDSALVIGGGVYLVPAKLVKENPDSIVDVVEIEPSLHQLGKKYFGVPDNPRLQSHITDGRRYLVDTKKKYQLIYADAYRTSHSVPSHLSTKEFYELVSSRLTDDGIFLSNYIGDLSQTQPTLLMSGVKTLQSVFDNVEVFAVESVERVGPQNFTILAFNGKWPINLDDHDFSGYHYPSLQALPERYVDLSAFDLSKALVLTDNYVPVDYLVAKSLLILADE